MYERDQGGTFRRERTAQTLSFDWSRTSADRRDAGPVWAEGTTARQCIVPSDEDPHRTSAAFQLVSAGLGSMNLLLCIKHRCGAKHPGSPTATATAHFAAPRTLRLFVAFDHRPPDIQGSYGDGTLHCIALANVIWCEVRCVRGFCVVLDQHSQGLRVVTATPLAFDVSWWMNWSAQSMPCLTC